MLVLRVILRGVFKTDYIGSRCGDFQQQVMAILSNVQFNLAMHMSLVLTMLMVRVMIGQYVARKCRANHQRNHCWVMHENS